MLLKFFSKLSDSVILWKACEVSEGTGVKPHTRTKSRGRAGRKDTEMSRAVTSAEQPDPS